VFFEAFGEAAENSPKSHSATAGLLMLRLIDHWVLAGPVMVEPESVSVKSVRNAIMQLDAKDPSREVLLGLVNTMQTIREVDIQPVLPRLFAYAACLEKRTELSLASDVYGTIARLAEENFDADLLIDSFLRLGYCQRMMGSLSDADAAYTAAGKIAKRQKETARALRAQIGHAIGSINRPDTPVFAGHSELNVVSARMEQSLYPIQSIGDSSPSSGRTIEPVSSSYAVKQSSTLLAFKAYMQQRSQCRRWRYLLDRHVLYARYRVTIAR